MIFQIWMYYFLFIKKIYKNRHRRTNLAAFNLSVACIGSILLFLLITLEILLHFKGVLFLIDQNIPLAPIGILLGLLLFIPVSLRFNKISNKDKYYYFRKAILKTKRIRRFYTLIYIIFSGLLFIIGLIMTISYSIIL
jgi:hypothetical protein